MHLSKPETLMAIQNGKCEHWLPETLEKAKLDDGEPDAVRGLERRGKIEACYPWLLADIFSIPGKRGR